MVAYAFRGARPLPRARATRAGRAPTPGVRKAIGVDALAADVPQDIHGIDLGPSPTPYERAERLAAEAFGAERSWFLTNGATQGNHALCLALAPLGTEIVAQRNSHTSIVDGLVLSGGIPSFVAPEYDAELGITHAVTPAALAAALARGARRARRVHRLADVLRDGRRRAPGWPRSPTRPSVPLVVDQSWGPHFGFHEALPPTALSQGADAMLTSTHKIAGSLTQSAMLHVGNRSGRDRIDIGAVARAIRLLRSTSPSSLLLASLDGARRQLVLHGEQLLHETLEAIAVARAKLETIPGIALVDDVARRADGRRGLRPAADRRRRPRDRAHRLRDRRRAAPLLRRPPRAADARRRSSSSSASASRRPRCGAWRATSRRPSSASRGRARRRRSSGRRTTLRNEVAVPPREAFLGEAEQLAVDDAVGRISCEAIASLPAGRAGAAAGRAHLGRDRRPTSASSRRAARACTARATRRFQTINVLREER